LQYNLSWLIHGTHVPWISKHDDREAGYLSAKTLKMVQLSWTIDVCQFCFSFHQKYAKKHPFSLAKKEVVAICSCCGNGMCSSCKDDSQKEIRWSILDKYEFELCADCCNSIRVTTTMKRQLEQAVKDAVVQVKQQIKAKIYLIKQEHEWSQ
jgi:hypothetical protein